MLNNHLPDDSLNPEQLPEAKILPSPSCPDASIFGGDDFTPGWEEDVPSMTPGSPIADHRRFALPIQMPSCVTLPQEGFPLLKTIPRLLNAIFAIQGQIQVTNNCDCQPANIPNQVVVEASLLDAQGQSITMKVNVNLAPRGRNQKVGQYRIVVTTIPGFGPPAFWTTPEATANGKDICSFAQCPDTKQCLDLRTKPRRIPIQNPVTNFDLEIVCRCL